ncbi:MAG: alpha-glucosidase [Bacteroidota bacterium]
MTKNWWKEGVIYQIYPRSFKDSNGDGIGDLRGIISELDYLQSLGIDILWLSPIYRSPNDDNGYDISDYYKIMEEFGNMADFDELLEGIHQRGMKLLMDLVVNHTSDEHEWFQQSRQSADNPYSDYYFWKKEKPNNWMSFFGGEAWEYDEKRQAYYLHLFTKKQPDLNWENPRVREEVYRLMRFWLDKGVDGFRMDVIPLISKYLDFPDADFSDFNQVIIDWYANGPRVHEFLQEMHREVIQHYDITTVGEGPGITKELANLYVGEDRKELHMIFHFGHMFIDHGEGGKFDIVDCPLPKFKRVFTEWHKAIGEEGWINIFLDNHDFPRMISRFGHDGIYREKAAKLLATLLLSLRGTPSIYQGSEIGMTNVAFSDKADYRDVETLNYFKELEATGGDLEIGLKKVHQQGRDNVRTPIQWNAQAHAGFTSGTPWIKVNPNYPQINVEAALADPNSVFYYYKNMLQFRKQRPTLIYGDYRIVQPEHEQLFAYHRFDEAAHFYIVLNFSEEACAIPWEGSQARDWTLLMHNEESVVSDHQQLGPWEARIYQKNQD